MRRSGRIMGVSGLALLTVAIFRDWVGGWVLGGYVSGTLTLLIYLVALGQLLCARMLLLLDEETTMTSDVHDDGCDRDHRPDAVCNPEAADGIEEAVGELVYGADGRPERRLLVLEGPNPLACPDCGQVGNWRRDGDEIRCAVDDALIMVESCPIEQPHCRLCGRTDTASMDSGYSTCCNKLITSQDDCTTWRDHDEPNR